MKEIGVLAQAGGTGHPLTRLTASPKMGAVQELSGLLGFRHTGRLRLKGSPTTQFAGPMKIIEFGGSSFILLHTNYPTRRRVRLIAHPCGIGL